LSTPDPDEAAVKRAMVSCANFVVVVADSSKIGNEEFVSFAPIQALDVLVTDSGISPAAQAELTREGLEVVVAQGAA
jgi:DeoR family fructose operon transcriptional repressor